MDERGLGPNLNKEQHHLSVPLIVIGDTDMIGPPLLRFTNDKALPLVPTLVIK